jgi:hypothetical protein
VHLSNVVWCGGRTRVLIDSEFVRHFGERHHSSQGLSPSHITISGHGDMHKIKYLMRECFPVTESPGRPPRLLRPLFSRRPERWLASSRSRPSAFVLATALSHLQTALMFKASERSWRACQHDGKCARQHEFECCASNMHI